MLALKFHCAMTCCVAINAKEGDFLIQLFNCVLSLMLHKCHISWQTVLTELSWSAKKISESTKHSWKLLYGNSVYRAHSGIKGKLVKNSVDQVLMVNGGNLVRVSVNQVHLVAKGFCKFVILTKHLLVNTENHFRISVYQARLANERFC